MENDNTKAALAVTVGVLITIVIILLFFQYDSKNKDKIQSAYDSGYVDGFNAGQGAAAKEVISTMKEFNNNYE